MAEGSPTIYRYKFTDEIVEMLSIFAKTHQYDDRHAYKKAWGIWYEDNLEVLEKEIRRIINLGYDGNVADKMFKAGRYYFRKKSPISTKPQTRRKYITFSSAVLDAMDRHIINNMNEPDYSPASGYSNFCENNIPVLKEEINSICSKHTITKEDMTLKIKKTYKNRYFRLTRTNS